MTRETLKNIVINEFAKATASLKRGRTMVINAQIRLRRARAAMDYLNIEFEEDKK